MLDERIDWLLVFDGKGRAYWLLERPVLTPIRTLVDPFFDHLNFPIRQLLSTRISRRHDLVFVLTRDAIKEMAGGK